MRVFRGFGLLLGGLVALSPSVFQGQAPRGSVSERGVENLVAYTKLLSYVRFFHPSDEAAATDWSQFAAKGVTEVERAPNAKELAATLNKLFRPIAPTVRVFPTAEGPGPSAVLPKPEGQVTAWRHVGVGLAPGGIYSSTRVGLDEDRSRQTFGNLMRVLDAGPYRGKRLRYRAAVRAEVSGQGNQAQLWLRVDRGSGMGFFDNMQDRPVVTPEWKVYEIAGKVDPDAVRISIGGFLLGKGRAWLDDVSLEVEADNGAWTPIAISNGSFEAGWSGSGPAGWGFPIIGQPPAYAISPDEENPRGGKLSAMIRSLSQKKSSAEADEMPDPSEPFRAELGAGVSCLVPLSLYVADGKTQPRGNPPAQIAGLQSDGGERSVRLASVALAWGVFQHFYPYFDVVEADWPGALRRALGKAAVDGDKLSFLATLRGMVAELDDGHGGVYYEGEPRFKPGLAWRIVEGKLVVSRTMGEDVAVRRGDVVLSIDGTPALEVFRETEKLVSASTAQHRRSKTLLQMLNGTEGSQMKLTVRRPGGDTASVTLNRNVPVKVYRVRPARAKVEELRPGVFYVDLSTIQQAEFDKEVEKLAAAKAVILDLRGYPRVRPDTIGHLTDKPLKCARWNVPVTMRPDREDVTFQFSNWRVQPKEPRFQGKAIFLTDGRAVSYAETYLGIIEHYELAEIVGEATAGTNGNVNPFTLPGGYRVLWTGMKVLKHDGSRHHGVGIQPTVAVDLTLAGVIEGRDEVLERALQLVRR